MGRGTTRPVTEDLLLRELNEVLELDGIGALKGSSRAEGPARTTDTLILHLSDGAELTPVDGGGELVLGVIDVSAAGI